MAKSQKKGRRSARGTTGRIRVRTRTAERRVRVPETPEVREVRERINQAISQGEELRRSILARIDRVIEEPSSPLHRRR